MEQNSFSSTFNNETDYREFRRGEIYYVTLDDVPNVNSHITNKSRPALIIQNNLGNLHSGTLIIAPLTSSNDRNYPFQYKVRVRDRDSTIMFDQIFTVDKYAVREKYAELSAQQMKEADQCLMYSLSLNRFSLEALVDFQIISLISKRTLDEVFTYFEFEFRFLGQAPITLKVSLEKLKEFDSTIECNVSLTSLKQKLDCCAGLSWIFRNAQIL